MIGTPEYEDIELSSCSVVRICLYAYRVLCRYCYSFLPKLSIPSPFVHLFQVSFRYWVPQTTFFTLEYVAGRLLRPLAQINEQVREIREGSLDKRMHVGKSPDEVTTLTNSLNNMFDRLEYSFQHQKEFVSNTAHEIKSPLTVLMVSNEEMLAGDLPDDVRCNLQKQQQTLLRLNKLVRDLLSIARLEQQDSLKRQTVNLKELIAYVLEEYEDIINARTIVLENEVASVDIQIDRGKFQRLLINLLDNAIKYNNVEGGWIHLRSEQKEKQIYLTISNSGPGIDAKDLSEIFKQFYRVEKSRSLDHGGSGLGLTISKRIVELHGGTIKAASNDKETSFVISLSDIQTS